MKSNLLLLACTTLFLGLIASGQDPKSNPRTKLETAIPDMIRLLEAKEHAALIKAYAHPAELKMILEKMTIEELAATFGKQNAEPLLKMLKSIQGIVPTYEKEDSRATYKLPEGVGPRDTVVFERVDGNWYIKN